MAVLKIASAEVLSPSRVFVTLNIKDKTDTNAAGGTVIDGLPRKRRVECEWSYLTRAQMATILTAIDTASKFFAITYFDPFDNALKTITVYTSEQVMGMQRYDGTTPKGWQDVKIYFNER